jgi:hypothetical protein
MTIVLNLRQGEVRRSNPMVAEMRARKLNERTERSSHGLNNWENMTGKKELRKFSWREGVW